MVCDMQQEVPREIRDPVGLILVRRRVDYPTETLRMIFRRKLNVTISKHFRDVDISLLVLFSPPY